MKPHCMHVENSDQMILPLSQSVANCLKKQHAWMMGEWRRASVLVNYISQDRCETSSLANQLRSSPRMPHTLGEIFTHAQYQISNTATAGPGADSVRVDHHVRSRARSQRPALLQAAAETTAGGSNGREDLKADRRVRHYKEVGLQEWPLAGRATAPRVLCGISLCMSLRRRTILSKRLRAPAPVDLTIHTFRTVDRTAGRHFAVVAQFGKR